SLVGHVVRAASPVAGNGLLVVVGHQAEQVKALLPGLEFVEQKEQLGTGHALIGAREALAGFFGYCLVLSRDALAGFSGHLLVLPGDVPLISTETIRAFLDFPRSGNFQASVLTAD